MGVEDNEHTEASVCTDIVPYGEWIVWDNRFDPNFVGLLSVVAGLEAEIAAGDTTHEAAYGPPLDFDRLLADAYEAQQPLSEG